jgi:hypothetical protein
MAGAGAKRGTPPAMAMTNEALMVRGTFNVDLLTTSSVDAACASRILRVSDWSRRARFDIARFSQF